LHLLTAECLPIRWYLCFFNACNSEGGTKSSKILSRIQRQFFKHRNSGNRFINSIASEQRKEQKRYLEQTALLNDGEAMPYFPLTQRLKIAIGGFIFFTGILLLILAFLTTTKAANLESIMPNELIIAIAAVVGILDVVCGFLLFRKS
jgi:hypothetical protein